MAIIKNKIFHVKKYPILLYLLILIAFLLHVDNFILKANGALGFIGLYFLFLSLSPYLIGLCYFKLSGFILPSIIGCTISLMLDGLMHYYVFISPQNSTAAIGFLFAPVINIFLVIITNLINVLFKIASVFLGGYRK